MKKTVITVEDAGNGMVVTFDGNGAECMRGLAAVLASAVANMAMGGTRKRDIEKQIKVCVDYGMKHGLEQAGRSAGGH